MIIPDLNLLIYAYDSKSNFHKLAKQWWETALSGSDQVALCWVVILGFIRITTNARVFKNPLSVEQSTSIVASWLECPNVTIINPSDQHFEILSEYLATLGVGANLVTDIHLATLAREFGGVLHSNDLEFGRFEKISWVNPITTTP